MILLLVDDDEVFRYTFKRVTGKIPEVEQLLTAENGQVAINILEDRVKAGKIVPTHIFLDINMPVMNGFEFLDAFRRLEAEYNGPIQSMIVAMLTSSILEEDRKRALNSGLVRSFILKPDSANDTLAEVRRALFNE